MRIAICGTANVGKTTFINDIIKKLPYFKTTETSYRDKLKKNNLSHSKKTNKKTQWFILNNMKNSININKNSSHIIYDRCPG